MAAETISFLEPCHWLKVTVMMTMSLSRKSFRDRPPSGLRSPGRFASTPVAATAISLTLAAAIAYGLLAVPQQAEAQSNDCERLSPWASVFEGAVTRDNQRPRNVSVQHDRDYQGRGHYFVLSWDIARQFPQSALTGHCIEKTHSASGKKEEFCSMANATATSGAVDRCFGATKYSHFISCERGSFDFRVRFTVSCTSTTWLSWSDSVSFTYD